MRDEMRLKYQQVIKGLGLTDKEAAVYLAALELGPSPVQVIARKARVARATTYVVLEGLMERGLATRVHEDARTLFLVESPRHLLRSVEEEAAAVQTKRMEIERILPELEAIMKQTGDKPTVRYFSGIEGLHTLRHEMAQYSSTKDVWRSLSPIDLLREVYGDDQVVYKARAAKGVPQRTIFTTNSRKVKEALLRREKADLTERRFVEPKKFKSASGLTVFGRWVAIGTFRGEVGGVIIESTSIAHMVSEMFDLVWEKLDGKK